jgi:phosphoglycolate phosphatase-like HAD superfamily hydrolase
MSTYILWDIDGTLIDNSPTGESLYLDAIEHVTGVRPTVAVDNPDGMTEGQLLTAILEANGLSANRLGEVLYDLDVISREQHERGHVRDASVGASEALVAIAERGWVNALLTGNGPDRARYKLLAAGFDPADFDWEHSYFGRQSPTRGHLAAGARTALAGQNVFIVGDTPTDGRAADSAGIPFLAVATGVYSSTELRSTSAVAVIEDLRSGLDDLLAAIDTTLAAAEVPLTPAAIAAPVPDSPADAPSSDSAVAEEIPHDDAPDDAPDDTDTRDIPIIDPEADLGQFGENPDVEVPTDAPAAETAPTEPATPALHPDDFDTDAVEQDLPPELEQELAEDFGTNPETDEPGEEERD